MDYNQIVADFNMRMPELYAEYIKNVSSMAPSLKTLKLLMQLCVTGNKVLDLGTGFSSFVLRYYLTDLGIDLISADDNSGWLITTRKYCESQGITYTDDEPNGFEHWKLLPNIVTSPVDVVFMDLGTTRRRVDYYADVLNRYCNENTLLLVDDMHKKILVHALNQELRHYTYLEIPVMNETKDEFGRYCRLFFRLRRKDNLNG